MFHIALQVVIILFMKNICCLKDGPKLEVFLIYLQSVWLQHLYSQLL